MSVWVCCAIPELKVIVKQGSPAIIMRHECGVCNCCQTHRCPNKMKKVYPKR